MHQSRILLTAAATILVSLINTHASYADREKTFLYSSATGTVHSNMLGGTRDPNLTDGPYALITADDGNDEVECSGVLVGPREVLTAAHCIASASGETQFTAADYSVRVGGADYGVASIHYNSKYDPDADVDDASSRNDLGMLILKSAVTGASPIPVVNDAPVSLGEDGTLYGFGTFSGYDDNTDFADPSQGRYGSIVITRVGTGVFDSTYSDGNVASCEGDSGGAIIHGSGSSRGVIGVVSSGTTSNANSGSCTGTAGDEESTYVDLQGSSSKAFLALFSEVQYTSGGGGTTPSGLTAKLNSIISGLQSAQRLRSLTQVRSKAASYKTKVSSLTSLISDAQRRAYNDAKSALGSVRSARNVTASISLLKRAVKDLRSVLAAG